MISRVHWLLDDISLDFRLAYVLVYNYAYHRYCFYRKRRKTMYDMFIIVRTSKRCWRVSYVNLITAQMIAFSCRKRQEVCEKLDLIYKENKEMLENKPP